MPQVVIPDKTLSLIGTLSHYVTVVAYTPAFFLCMSLCVCLSVRARLCMSLCAYARVFVCTKHIQRRDSMFTTSTLSTGDYHIQFDTVVDCERRRAYRMTLHILGGHFCWGVVQRVAPWNFVRACTLAICQSSILRVVSRAVIRTVFILQRIHTNI